MFQLRRGKCKIERMWGRRQPSLLTSTYSLQDQAIAFSMALRGDLSSLSLKCLNIESLSNQNVTMGAGWPWGHTYPRQQHMPPGPPSWSPWASLMLKSAQKSWIVLGTFSTLRFHLDIGGRIKPDELPLKESNLGKSTQLPLERREETCPPNPAGETAQRWTCQTTWSWLQVKCHVCRDQHIQDFKLMGYITVQREASLKTVLGLESG